MTMRSFLIPRTGVRVPAIAFGSGSKWRVKKLEEGWGSSKDPILIKAIEDALAAGYRHLDTAEVYETHGEIAEAFKNSGIARSQITITSKYLPGYRGKHAISKSGPYEAIQRALRELDTNYIDCYYIHNPFFNLEWTHGITVEEAWKQVERALEEGLVKNIGVSNFDIEMYQKVLDCCTVKPHLYQTEMHPYLPNQHPGIIDFAKVNDAQVVAYGALTPLLRVPEGPLVQTLERTGVLLKKTPAQILLRWAFERGAVVLTTSSNPQRLRESLEIFEFDLPAAVYQTISDVGSTYPHREYFQDEWGQPDR